MIYLDKPKVLFTLLATLLFLILPHLGYMPVPVFAVMAAAGLYRYRIFRLQLHYLSSSTAGFLAVCCAGVIYVCYGRFQGQDVMVSFYSAMVMFKVLESRSDRDTLLVICLAYPLMGTTFMFNQDMWTLVYLLTGSVLLTMILVGIQHADGLRQLKKSFVTSAGMVCLAIPLAVVMFLLVPRGGGFLWSFGVHGLPTTGISDHINFTSMSRLNQDSSIAFRVDFKDPQQLHDRYYWRGVVFGNFDGYGWKPSDKATTGSWGKVKSSGPAVEYTVTLEPHRQPWIFTMDMPMATPLKTNVNSERQIVLKWKRKVMDRFQYSLHSAPDFTLLTTLSKQKRRFYLQYPPTINTRTIEQAKKWRLQYNSDNEYVNAVLNFISTGDFYYTLDPGRFASVHSVDDFWFNKRRGYCQHYASAFALLMRAGGIPARLIGGYQGGEVNPLDNYLMVRQLHAHAWVEVFLKGRGWVRVDPTAAISAQRTEQSLQQNLQSMQRAKKNVSSPDLDKEELPNKTVEISYWDKLRFHIDSINHRWNDWVLNYDSEKRKVLFKALGSEKIQNYWFVVLCVAVVLFAVIVRLCYWIFRGEKVDKVSKSYQLFCRKMAKKGIARQPYEGPRDFIVRAKTALPELSEQLELICELYISLRYRPPGSSGKSEKELLWLVKSL